MSTNTRKGNKNKGQGPSSNQINAWQEFIETFKHGSNLRANSDVRSKFLVFSFFLLLDFEYCFNISCLFLAAFWKIDPIDRSLDMSLNQTMLSSTSMLTMAMFQMKARKVLN